MSRRRLVPSTDPNPEPLIKPPALRGRKRDATRDPQILEAALAVLVEVGYEQMTMDQVAARAGAGKATLYRRWPTKGHLILAAIARADKGGPSAPDRGSLRDDLLAMIDPDWLGGAHERTAILSGLASALASTPELAASVNAILVEPSVEAYRTIFRRAVARGEIPTDSDIDLLSQTLPSMTTYQTLFRDRPVDRAFIESIIDRLLLPAARAARDAAGAAR